MSLKVFTWVLFLMFVNAPLVFCQASPETLKAITSRGQMLAEYDAAAWVASDVVLSEISDRSLVKRYIARKVGGDWEVVFGKFNEKNDAFVVNYKYTKSLDLAKQQKIPYEDKEYYYQAARAIDVALKEFGNSNKFRRPFNTAVLPEGDNFYVYVYPAPLKEGVYPLGGDWRYLVSNKAELLETRQLHKAIIEFDSLMPEDVKSGYHVAILDDQPEDTDVYYVLTRKPLVPELVVTRKYVYRIEKDGQIRYLGTVKDVLGGDSK